MTAKAKFPCVTFVSLLTYKMLTVFIPNTVLILIDFEYIVFSHWKSGKIT